MHSRSLNLRGIHNFRDYGGYRIGQSRMRSSVLFRSGQHGGATDEDLVAVESLQIKKIIDLRSPGERRDFPCRRSAGFRGAVLHLEDDALAPNAKPPHFATAAAVKSVADAHDLMRAGYAEMPFRPEQLIMFGRYLNCLSECDAPTLIHCFAGKDRTGLAVALLHRLLGLHPDDIMADYMLTNVAGDPERRIAEGLAAIQTALGGAIDEPAMRVLMSVDPSYLAVAMRAIDAGSGGFDSYLRRDIGFTYAMRDAIAARLIVI